MLCVLLLQLLRMQLRFLKAYLFTCKQSVADDLRKQVWPKEYYYDDIHLYSLLVGVFIFWHRNITFQGKHLFVGIHISVRIDWRVDKPGIIAFYCSSTGLRKDMELWENCGGSWKNLGITFFFYLPCLPINCIKHKLKIHIHLLKCKDIFIIHWSWKNIFWLWKSPRIQPWTIKCPDRVFHTQKNITWRDQICRKYNLGGSWLWHNNIVLIVYSTVHTGQLITF